MKPRIFIGSSREGLPIAKQIKIKLVDIADCQIWTEGFFENNKSSFESLQEGSTLFDFAILVATEDDVVLKRDTLEVVARDNVILEFGMYVGRLGRNRSFFIKQKGLDLPSDLLGITLPEFRSSTETNGLTLSEVCESIKQRINELWQTFELSFVPSTVLAIGYFENFVARVCRELMQASQRTVDGNDFKTFKLHIAIPDQLPNDFNDQVIAYLSDRSLKAMEVKTDTRKYNFYLDYSMQEGDILELFDLPTTLQALKQSIEMAIPKSYIGETTREMILKRKEMTNFYRTLTYLVNENAITRKQVVIEFIDVDG